MKKLLAILTAILFIVSLCACGNKKEAKPEKDNKPINMNIACLKGPTGVGMANLMEDSANNKLKNNYTFTVAASADEISGKIVSGEINIASVPTNLASKLYNKTGGKIQMLAVNTLGALSIIENGNTIKTISDLKGKTIFSIGEGSNPEYILRHILKENNLQNDVTIHFVATNDDLVTSIISGKADIAMVPEPAATTVLSKKTTLRRALSVNDEWNKISDGELMMGCIVSLKSFVEENKSAVDNFLKEYKSSIELAVNSPTKTAELCEKYEIIPSKEIAEKAIPDCNTVYIEGNKIMKEIEDYFSVLLGFSPDSIGGKLPAKDFYYEK